MFRCRVKHCAKKEDIDFEVYAICKGRGPDCAPSLQQLEMLPLQSEHGVLCTSCKFGT